MLWAGVAILNLIIGLTAFKDSTAGIVIWWLALVLTIAAIMVQAVRVLMHLRLPFTPELLSELLWVPFLAFLLLDTLFEGAPAGMTGLSKRVGFWVHVILLPAVLVSFGAAFVWWYRDSKQQCRREVEEYKRKRELSRVS